MISKNPRQTSMFEAFPTPPLKMTATDSTTVDYTSGPVGAGWGHRKVTVMCPKCDRPGIFKEGSNYDTWIHCVELRLDHKNNARPKTISSCNNKAPKVTDINDLPSLPGTVHVYEPPEPEASLAYKLSKLAWLNMKEFLEGDLPKETLLQMCDNNIAVLEALEEK